MERSNFTQYDEFPREMLIYMRNYGPHFNRKLYEFAVSHMTKKVGDKEVRIKPYTKEETDNLLNTYGIEVSHGQLYDAAYVASMCKADFLNSSVPDEPHMALYIKDVIDDVDAPDGLVFNRFYADCCYNGIAINWEDML